MLVRVLIALVAVLLTTPAFAACPWQRPAAAAAPDCCHKTKNCPKPAKVQPCFTCVAEVPTAAAKLDQTAKAVAPAIPWFPIFITAVPYRMVLTQGTLLDSSSTYLRIGVLRL